MRGLCFLRHGGHKQQLRQILRAPATLAYTRWMSQLTQTLGNTFKPIAAAAVFYFAAVIGICTWFYQDNIQATSLARLQPSDKNCVISQHTAECRQAGNRPSSELQRYALYRSLLLAAGMGLMFVPFSFAASRWQRQQQTLEQERQRREAAEERCRQLESMQAQLQQHNAATNEKLQHLQHELLERRAAGKRHQLQQALLEQAPYPLAIYGDDGHFRYLNSAARQTWKLSDDRPVDSIQLKDWLTGSSHFTANQLGSTPMPLNLEAEWPDPHTQEMTAKQLTLFQLAMQSAGRTQYFGIVAYDVGGQKQQLHALQQAKQAAEATARAQSGLLADMGHEIRTTVHGILGMIDLLEESPLNDEQADFLAMARQAAGKLQLLVHDVLELAKIESGRLDVEEMEFNLIELVDELVIALQRHPDNCGVPINVSQADNLNGAVVGDPKRIRQVLEILLGNAIKYTRTGQIDVTLTLRDESPDWQQVGFSIRDTGCGIATDKQSSLFDFSRHDENHPQPQSGVGLGLPIASRLVELMGGNIWLESQSGAGSTFHFSLRLAKILLPSSPDMNIGPEETTRQNRSLSILVAEDNLVNQTLIEHLLEHLGHRATLVDNGAAAVKARRNGQFDFILMDLQMPILGGIDATRQIRALEAEQGLPPIPIYALTANSRSEDRTRCEKAGMNGFIPKPVCREALIAATTSENNNILHK